MFVKFPQFFLKPSTIPKKFGPPGKFLLKFLHVFYISRGKQNFSRSEVEGGKVGRLDVGKIGRFEGGKARKNLRKVAVGSSLPSSLLIPSTIPSLYLPHKNFDKWHSATYLPQNIQPWIDYAFCY